MAKTTPAQRARKRATKAAEQVRVPTHYKIPYEVVDLLFSHLANTGTYADQVGPIEALKQSAEPIFADADEA